jgi:peptidoglycan hydrolase CwlO-like protein
MKINFLSLVFLTMSGAMIAYIVFDKQTSRHRLEAIDKSLDSLEQALAAKDTIIASYNKRIARLTDSIYDTEKRIDKYKSQLKNIKDKYATIKPTTNATAGDVVDFFSNRYDK